MTTHPLLIPVKCSIIMETWCGRKSPNSSVFTHIHIMPPFRPGVDIDLNGDFNVYNVFTYFKCMKWESILENLLQGINVTRWPLPRFKGIFYYTITSLMASPCPLQLNTSRCLCSHLYISGRLSSRILHVGLCLKTAWNMDSVVFDGNMHHSS